MAILSSNGNKLRLRTAIILSALTSFFACNKSGPSSSQEISTDVGRYLPSQNQPTNTRIEKSDKIDTVINTSENTPRSLELSAQNLVMAAGNSQDLKALAIFTDDSRRFITPSVTWVSQAPAIADFSGDPLTVSRLIAKKVGTAKVKGTYKNLTSEIDITVVEPALHHIEVYPTTFLVGIPQLFTATAVYENGLTNELTGINEWTSNEPSLLSAVPSAAKGTFVAQVAKNYALSIISDTVNGSAIVSARIPEFESIEVTSAQPSLPFGGSLSLRANGVLFDRTKIDITQAVSWISSKITTMTVTTDLGNAGTVRAVGPGTATITASVVSAGRTLSASKDLSVITAQYKSIKISGLDKSIPMFYKKNLKATGVLNNGSEVDITSEVEWTAEDASIATISNTIPGEISGRSMGVTKITAKYGDVSASGNLTVVDVALVELTVLRPEASIQCGTGTSIFTVTGKLSDGTDSPDINSSVTWFSSDNSMATISNEAALRGALSSKKPGTVRVTAKYLESKTGETIESSVDVVIGGPVLTGYVMIPSQKYLLMGKTMNLSVVGKYSCALGGTLAAVTDEMTWSLSSSAYAKLDPAKKGFLKAEKAGASPSLEAATPVTVIARKGTLVAECIDNTIGGCVINIKPREIVAAKLSYQPDASGNVFVDVNAQNSPMIRVQYSDDPAETFPTTLSYPFAAPGHSFLFYILRTLPSSPATVILDPETGVVEGRGVGSADIAVAISTPSAASDPTVTPVAASSSIAVNTTCEGDSFPSGMRFNRYCFYEGLAGESCLQVCSSKNRAYDASATESIIGGSNGSMACKTFITNYFDDIAENWPDPTEIPGTPSQGIGCSITTRTIFSQLFQVPYYYPNPSPTGSASLPNVKRICGCN